MSAPEDVCGTCRNPSDYCDCALAAYVNAPRGLGWWVAFEAAVDAGPKAADLAKIVAVCNATGATWAALRCGAGSQPDAHLTAESIETLHAAGLKVYLWPFCYAAARSAEVSILRKWFALKEDDRDIGKPLVDGVILNAEFEFMAHASAEEARALVREVRAIGYDFVAHAPPDYAGARGDGPLAALDDVCDAILPQCYGYEHNDLGHVHTLKEVLGHYAARGLDMNKVWPILCSYRPLTRGYTADKKPIPTQPITNEAAVVARDVVAGLDYIDSIGGCPAPSIYTIDALAFASRPGVGAAVLQALSDRHARHATTDPTPPPSPFDIGTAPGDWRPQSAETALHDLYAMDSREPDTTPQTPASKSSQSLRAVRPETLDAEATWPAGRGVK